jgi:hypothetical protein
MKKAGNFYNILDECLERVLVKGETVEQCLAAYSEHAAELEPLLQTALVAKEATDIKPRPEFRERASYQFQAALREMESKKSRGFFGWQPRWATAVIVVVVLLLAGSGTVIAAGNSMPDEPLYQVKLATEAVRLTLAPSTLDKAELYVKLADKRVAEIIEMVDKGNSDQVEQTAQRLNTQLIAMASLTAPAGGELVEKEAASFEAAAPPQMAVEGAPRAEVKEVPQVKVSEAPPAVVDEKTQMAAEEAPQVTVSEAPRVTAGEAPPEPTPVPAPALAPTPAPVPVEEVPPADVEEVPVTTAPRAWELPADVEPAQIHGGDDEGIRPDEQAELRMLLSRSAAENGEALQAVLERAPESVKPALRRAIEQALAGYEQALRNLD